MWTTTQAGTITIHPGDHEAVIRDIDFQVYTIEFKQNLICWCAENESIGIRATVESKMLLKKLKWYNFRRLKEEIIEDLDFMIDYYLVQGTDKITVELRRDVDNLKEYVDPSRRTNSDHWSIQGENDSPVKTPTGKQDRLGRASMVLCIIAAFYIAVVPETILSTIAWITYAVGAVTGIIHLRRAKDRATMQMYIIWLVLDLYAFFRLITGIHL